jgi:hypothetical protein
MLSFEGEAHMIGTTLARGIVLSAIGMALSACATTSHTDASILETLDAQSRAKPQSCAAMDQVPVCQSGGLSSHLDRRCQCMDRRALTDPNFR